jgi:hypothetical protein
MGRAIRSTDVILRPIRGWDTDLRGEISFKFEDQTRKSQPENFVMNSAPNASDGVKKPARGGDCNNRSTAASAVITVSV